jgi:transposase
MHFKRGSDHNQTTFSTLDDQVEADNPVRLMDAFVDKLNLSKPGFGKIVHKSEGRPPYQPGTLLKRYLYGYPFGTIKRQFGFKHTRIYGICCICVPRMQ